MPLRRRSIREGKAMFSQEFFVLTRVPQTVFAPVRPKDSSSGFPHVFYLVFNLSIPHVYSKHPASLTFHPLARYFSLRSVLFTQFPPKRISQLSVANSIFLSLFSCCESVLNDFLFGFYLFVYNIQRSSARSIINLDSNHNLII